MIWGDQGELHQEVQIFRTISYKYLQTRLKMSARLPNDWRNTEREVTVVTRADQALLEAVQQNTIAVQRLVEQMTTIQSQIRTQAFRTVELLHKSTSLVGHPATIQS